jgi:hypothetical protein
MMQAEQTAIPTVKILTPKKHSDAPVFLKYSRAARNPDRRNLSPVPGADALPTTRRQMTRLGTSKLVNFVFTLRQTPSEHEAQERRRCDGLLSFARSLSA